MIWWALLQAQNCLTKLYKLDKMQFRQTVRDYVNKDSLNNVVDFLHALLGFCMEPVTDSKYSWHQSLVCVLNCAIGKKPCSCPSQNAKCDLLFSEYINWILRQWEPRELDLFGSDHSVTLPWDLVAHSAPEIEGLSLIHPISCSWVFTEEIFIV